MKLITNENGITYLKSHLIKSPHGFSTRIGGKSTVSFLSSLNLKFTEYEKKEVTLENIDLFCKAIGVNSKFLTTSKQTHGDCVFEVKSEDIGTGIVSPTTLTADGLITKVPGVALGVRTADCTPILIEGRDINDNVKYVSAVHSGWRGTALGIVKNSVNFMLQMGISPLNIYVAIGPHIGSCCFETREDCHDEFFNKCGTWVDEFITKKNERYFPNLTKINVHWLHDLGITDDNIDVSDLCTCCSEGLFYSHRKSGVTRGSMMSIIGIDGGTI